MKFDEMVRLHNMSYGNAITINRWLLRSPIIALGIIIPIIFPVPLAAYLSRKLVKNNIIWRY